jgi:hypothetical protein
VPGSARGQPSAASGVNVGDARNDEPPRDVASEEAAHVDRLLETVAALTAVQADQTRDLERLLEVLETLTAAQQDTLETLAQLQLGLAALDARAAPQEPRGEDAPD